MINIIIDDRERHVMPYFNEFVMPPNITYAVDRITYGDYSVLYKENILFVIERKTWKDLASSIRDGRKENVNKLLKLRTDTGCQILYLIEGNPIPSADTKFCRIPYKALRSHLDHLAFRDNIHIVHSKDIKNTVSRIVELITNYLTISPSPLLKFDTLPLEIQEQGSIKLKEKIQKSPESLIYKIWCCIPNITEKTACLFIDEKYHISDLILGKITKDKIYSMKYTNGYIIGKRSEKIWSSSRISDNNIPIFIKMLSQINNVTKKTASTILTNISFEKILNGESSIDCIKEIQKTANRKVGIKVATEIIKCFLKKN